MSGGVKKTTTQDGNQADLINYRFDEVFKRLDRMEGKMDSFAFVSRTDFEEFKKEIRDTYLTKIEAAPMQRLIYGLASIILTGVVLALLRLVTIK